MSATLPGLPKGKVFAEITTQSGERSFMDLDDGGAIDPGDRNLLLQVGPDSGFYNTIATSTPSATLYACLVYGSYSDWDERRWVAHIEARWSATLRQFRQRVWESRPNEPIEDCANVVKNE